MSQYTYEDVAELVFVKMPSSLSNHMSPSLLARNYFEDPLPMEEQILSGILFNGSEQEYKEVSELSVGDTFLMGNITDVSIDSEEYTYLKQAVHEYKSLSFSMSRWFINPIGHIVDISEKYMTVDIVGGSILRGKRIRVLKEEGGYEAYVESETPVRLISRNPDRNYKLRLQAIYLYNKMVRELQDEIIDPHQQIEELAEDIYPGRTEMKLAEDVSEVSILADSLEMSDTHILLIYFPEITIENRIGKTHTMYENYVAIKFSNIGRLRTFEFARASLEAREVATRYTHSHVYNSRTRFGGFCTGEGSFHTNLCVLREEFDIELLEGWLTQLQFVLEWESIEGGPHNYIRRVKNGGVTSVEELISEEVRDIVLQIRHIIDQNSSRAEGLTDLTISDEGGGVINIEVGNTDKIAEFLQDDETVINFTHCTPSMFESVVVSMNSDGNYVEELTVEDAKDIVDEYTSSADYQVSWENGGFYFQGERIVQEVYVDEDSYDLEGNDSRKVLHPDVDRKVKELIRKNCLNQIATELNDTIKQEEEVQQINQQNQEFPEEILTSTPVFRNPRVDIE